MGPAAMPSTDSLPWGSFWLSRVPTGLSLAPRVCRLKVPSWTAVWSLEWSAASSFEAGDTCSKEPIILLLPISDISGVCTCKFIVFGPFWFQLRFSREKSSTENIWGVWTHIRTREFFAYNLTNSEPWGNKVNQIEFPLFWDVIKLVKLERPHTTKSPPNVAEEGKSPPISGMKSRLVKYITDEAS